MSIQKSNYNQKLTIYLKYRNFTYYNFDFNSNLEPILTSKEEYATCSIEHIIGGEFDIIQYLNNYTIEVWNPNMDSIVINGELIQPLTSSTVNIEDHLYWINNSKINYLNFKSRDQNAIKIEFSEFFNFNLPVKIFIVQEIIAVILLIIFNGFSIGLTFLHLFFIFLCFCHYNFDIYDDAIKPSTKQRDNYQYNKVLKVINTDIYNKSLVDVKKKNEYLVSTQKGGLRRNFTDPRKSPLGQHLPL